MVGGRLSASLSMKTSVDSEWSVFDYMTGHISFSTSSVFLARIVRILRQSTSVHLNMYVGSKWRACDSKTGHISSPAFSVYSARMVMLCQRTYVRLANHEDFRRFAVDWYRHVLSPKSVRSSLSFPTVTPRRKRGNSFSRLLRPARYTSEVFSNLSSLFQRG